MADFTVDYNDERFKNVETEKNNAINEVKNTYDQMINNSDAQYQNLINASKEYADKQTELQNQQTEFTIEKINQEKEKAEKDYIKEQKGAYADYQKSTNAYGVNAENLASNGLNKTGYSETTRTNAYNTYQNRYMSARETYNDAIQNFDNSITEAKLANSSTIAQIAYNALKEQLELSLEGFQYKNTLIENKLNAVNEEEDRYYSRYQDVLNQINTENQLKFEQEQAAQEQANWEKEYALSLASLRKSSSSSSKSSSKSSGSSSSSSGGTASLTNSNNALSSTATGIYNTIKKISSFTGNPINSSIVRNNIYNNYQNGKITDDEAEKIFNLLGL